MLTTKEAEKRDPGNKVALAWEHDNQGGWQPPTSALSFTFTWVIEVDVNDAYFPFVNGRCHFSERSLPFETVDAIF